MTVKGKAYVAARCCGTKARRAFTGPNAWWARRHNKATIKPFLAQLNETLDLILLRGKRG
jgi:hypothetical protein